MHGGNKPLDAVERNLSCIYVRSSSSDEMDHSVCRKELKHRVSKVGEYYGLEHLSSTMGRAHLLRSNSAVHAFTTELSWSHHRIHVNRFYVGGTAQTDTEPCDCGEYNGRKERNFPGRDV